MATYAEVASLAGTVIDQQASVGEMANGLVLIIADLTTVWLEIPVPERMSVGLKKGMRGSLITNTKMMESQTPIYIDYVSPMLDADTRTQMIRATLVNHSGKWKPGQMWKVILLGAESHSVLAVPSISVQTWNGKRMIFARETDTVFAALEIKIGKEMGGWIEVVSGLSQGDSVVTQGAFELKSKLATANMGDGHNH
jgi:cobalt-zinc-cadmium efflux system membrane fusion protein